MHWAVHWFKQVLLILLHHDGRKLGVLVVGIMPRDFEQVDLANMRRVDGLVTALLKFILDECFENAANHGSFRLPEY